MKNKEVQHSVFQNVIHLLGMVFKNRKIAFVLILLEMAASGVFPLFGLYLPKLAVELVMDNNGLRDVVWTLGTFAAAFVVTQCVCRVAAEGKYPFQNNMRSVYLKALYKKALDCDYNIMETSDGQTRYEKAKAATNNGDGSAPSVMFESIRGLISGCISFAFIFGIISKLNIYILMGLVVLSVFNYFLNTFAVRYEESRRDESAEVEKKFQYLKGAMADTAASKDIRIYNLRSLFESIKEKLLAQSFELHRKIYNRHFLFSTMKMAVALCRDGVGYAYCIWQVQRGAISIPDFILYMGAIASFSSWLNGIVCNAIALRRENTRINDLRSFFDYTNKLDPEDPLPISKIKLPIEIEFRNVSFSYTDDTPKILDGLNFRISPNEKIALVGVNGAGKTTIVKLLCGFYKATEGEITINGYNIDAFKRADLYTLFSAVFQDICILPLSVEENIAFEKITENNRDKLLSCLQTAGIKDEILKYEKGTASPMLKALEPDGIVLSGGQQQKLLLARALYKNAPILILDEPTAALDPIAESEVYEKFHCVTENKTAVYISHRLASTRFCDRILMLKNGRIIENGSHSELLAKNGEYAYMYEVQSHYYKEEETA